jgi:hypothetical protein
VLNAGVQELGQDVVRDAENLLVGDPVTSTGAALRVPLDVVLVEASAAGDKIKSRPESSSDGYGWAAAIGAPKLSDNSGTTVLAPAPSPLAHPDPPAHTRLSRKRLSGPTKSRCASF